MDKTDRSFLLNIRGISVDVGKLIERRFEDKDQSGLLDLLKSSYDGWHSMEYWTWKYKQNPHGHPLIWVAEDKRKIVGCYILNPVKIRLGRISILCAQSVDAAVDTACRGQGIFKRLARNTITQASQEGIVVTFAFPTEIAYKGQVRIGYRPMFIIPKIYKILNAHRLLEEQHNRFSLGKASNILRLYEKVSKRRVRLMSNKTLTVKRINHFDSRFEVFWKRTCEGNTNVLIERNMAYLNWRYFKHPEKSYIVYVCEDDGEVIGYSVLSVEKNVSTQRDKAANLSVGNIIDLLTLPKMNHASFHLISCSLDYFEREDVDIVGCWMFKKHPYHAILRKFGFSEYYELFRRVLLRPKYIDQFIVYVNSRATLRKALESNPQHTQLYWFIMQGDADYT